MTEQPNYSNQPGRKNCQDDQEVTFTEGLKERTDVEDWQYKAPEQVQITKEMKNDSKYLEYSMATILGGILLLWAAKEGCNAYFNETRASEKHIQETYNPKGLQKRIEEGRE